MQSSYQALPGNSMQTRLRLAEMHPLFVNSGGRSLHTNAFPGRAWERVVSCATLIPISGTSVVFRSAKVAWRSHLVRSNNPTIEHFVDRPTPSPCCSVYEAFCGDRAAIVVAVVRYCFLLAIDLALRRSRST